IESVMMRIPLPVFYFAEDIDGKMIVVDGLQRLSTFARFADGKLVLDLDKNSPLVGKTFSQLEPKLQNRFEDCNLVLYVIDSKVPNRARLDIFERVNSGLPLTKQQMRNSLFMGEGTKLLKRESRTALFLEATGGSLDQDKMRDREFMNRFCAFHLLPLDEYKGDLDEYLATVLLKMNDMTDKQLVDISNELQLSLRNNLAVFGIHAFRKHQSIDQGRSQLNASLWDVMSTGLARYTERSVASSIVALRTHFYQLMKDDTFIDAITSGTNAVKKVHTRFRLAKKMFAEVLG
ncbi:DUF262 domain-containing protein, partial [bacterium]|nr:DUF262 domain-containing protein [bacterium]